MCLRTLESALYILYIIEGDTRTQNVSKCIDDLQIIIFDAYQIPRLHIMLEFRNQFGIRLIRYEIYFAQLSGHLIFLLSL